MYKHSFDKAMVQVGESDSSSLDSTPTRRHHFKMRPIFCFCNVLILISIVSWFPSFVWAESGEGGKFQEALKSYQHKDYRRSVEQFLKLTRLHPKNSLYWFNLGNSYFMLRNYHEAGRSYFRVIRLHDGLVNPAKWYRAKAWFKMGREQAALRALKSLLAQADLSPIFRQQVEADYKTRFGTVGTDPHADHALALYKSGRYQDSVTEISKIHKPSPEVLLLKSMDLAKLNRTDEARRLLKSLGTDDAQNLLDQIEFEQASQKNIWAYVNFSLGHEANVYQDPPTVSSTAKFVSDNFWGAGGRLYRSGKNSYLLNYYGSWNEIFGVSSLQTLTHQLYASYGYNAHPWHLQAGPYYEKDFWGGQGAFHLTGVKFKAREYWSRTEWGANVDFAQRDADQTQYSYLSGTLSSLRLYFGITAIPFYSQVYLSLGQDHIGDIQYTTGKLLPEAQDFYGLGARGFWKINRDWMSSLELVEYKRHFTAHAIPDNVRRDTELIAKIRIVRSWTRKFSGYLLATFTNNASTLGPSDVADKNFSDQVFLAGISWSSL